MYDDYWDEPSEYDEMILELKYKLRESVRQEIKDEIEQLNNELTELQDVKKNWHEKLRELEQERYELRKAQGEAENNAKKCKLSELLDVIQQEAWSAYGQYEYLHEKCDKCDKNGYIHFKSPSGKDCKEECECRKRAYLYHPKPLKLYKIHQRINNSGKPQDPWVYYAYSESSGFYPGEKDEDIELLNIRLGEKERRDSYHSVFFNKEDCQKYCDELNEEMKKKYEIS